MQKEGEASLIKVRDESFSPDFDFPIGLQLMLDNIRREWAGSGPEKFRELMKFVYATAPMIEAQKKHKPEDKASLDLQLEHKKNVDRIREIEVG
ncbi:hypothetical protein [Spirulina major]|uniref:hypothetical protein n=1 Tax=Spirulina major TaxID=270636 RepID=UPI00093236DC|nr:hypothetical protein [Spirulina major]